jgi:hypothetical protein
MKKMFELMRVNEIILLVKKWVKKNRRDDDDMFDHPFAIF